VQTLRKKAGANPTVILGSSFHPSKVHGYGLAHTKSSCFKQECKCIMEKSKSFQQIVLKELDIYIYKE
jgi:hypothetical protein